MKRALVLLFFLFPGAAHAASQPSFAQSCVQRYATFATRADIKGSELINKKQLVMVGGGLAVALLFFLFTVVTGKSPKRRTSASKQTTQQSKPTDAKPSKGSVTPVMETVRTPERARIPVPCFSGDERLRSCGDIAPVERDR